MDGTVRTYPVHGTGPVCVTHPGGPGIAREHLRVPVTGRHLTMVYVEPVGNGAPGDCPGAPTAVSATSRFLEVLITARP
ncbi:MULTISPECIES: hypothetical protein [Streptomyces]|uniref:Uncharacterized protein n=1 Tax=Streptomyces canarius TaxID=285453 RepID=A0ABQ3D199_9ACTN|nr:hypothetical protein [Streptomyces canarius]GHA52868.1 hypothetical protein GCM10010345_66990 [Streptomyces canarius]